MGYWIEENRRPKSFKFVCSVCGRTAYDTPLSSQKHGYVKTCKLAYCPHCGAKMDECTKCHGRGEYFWDDHCQGVWMECDQCHGTGKAELTNAEYIRTASDEEQEAMLWERINMAFNEGYACCNLKHDKDYIGRYNRFKAWLKEKLHG